MTDLITDDVIVKLLPLISAWKTPQTELPKVVRWSKYVKTGARPQNSLQHSHSISLLGAIVLPRLHSYTQLDMGLVMAALVVHDIGEGEIGKDTLYIDKAVDIDLQEYLAFRKRYEPLGERFDPIHNAFLLQFAIKNPDIFPPDARKIMSGLAADYKREALAFDAIERLDYVLYALEQYHERGDVRILVRVFRLQAPHLDQLAQNLLGFGDAFWTQDIRTWCDAILREYEGMWIEQKGEK